VSALVGFAGDMFSLWAGIVIGLAFWWFLLSYWLDGAKLILATVGVNAAFYLAGALLAPDLALGGRLLAVLGVALGAALVARYWLWRESRKYGPGDI
jgi:hypothetical protein